MITSNLLPEHLYDISTENNFNLTTNYHSNYNVNAIKIVVN